MLSLLLGAGGLFLFSRALPREPEDNTWGILSVDESLEDRRIRELLEKAGIWECVSESTQEFSIDDFGAVKRLNLETYREELEPFDPRDDGYGEKLRSVFVHNGKRHFFIPLKDTGNPGKIEKNAAAALGDIPFYLDIPRNTDPIGMYVLAAAVSSLAALFLSREKARFALQIPVLLAFAWAGTGGIILAGILTGLGELLREPLGEFFPFRAYGTIGDKFKTFRANWILAVFYTFLFFLLCIPAGIPRVPAAAGFVCFLAQGILFPGIQKMERKNAAHILFTPLRIFPGPAAPPGFQPCAAVFAAAAFLVLSARFFFPSFPYPEGKGRGAYSGYLLSFEDYEQHLAFQASFSYIPLRKNGEKAGNEGYFRYTLGEDGLISGTDKQSVPDGSVIPPFPLEKLMEFLVQYTTGTGDTPPVQEKDWILLILLVLSCFPNRFRLGGRNGKKKKAALLRERRIAA